MPEFIKKELNLEKEEYRELYTKLADKKYITQIKDDDIYLIGKKKLKGSKIKNAILKAQDSLISGSEYNELNFYNPKINAFVAKVNKMEDIPDSYLEFARKYDLPIYILGSDNMNNEI